MMATRRPTPPRRAPTTRTVMPRGRMRLAFFRETWSELKKVAWPTRQEAINLTVVVIVVSVVVGLLLGTIDLGFSKLIDLLLVR